MDRLRRRLALGILASASVGFVAVVRGTRESFNPSDGLQLVVSLTALAFAAAAVMLRWRSWANVGFVLAALFAGLLFYAAITADDPDSDYVFLAYLAINPPLGLSALLAVRLIVHSAARAGEGPPRRVGDTPA